MHHELFLALLGHTGDVIERRADGFFIRPDATFLSQSQCSVLNRLLQLGFAYAVLEQFLRRASTLPSVYVHALAQAVQRLLDRYTDAIVELEAKLLANRTVFPVSNLIFELEEYLEIVPEVCTLVHGLTAKAHAVPQNHDAPCVPGAKVLSLVYQHTHSGFPRVSKCMQQLLYSCHRVLFQQMMAWMVYGELVDPYEEFFIKKIPGPPKETGMWHEQFTVDLDAIPLDYLPPSVAHSVFAIGKAVHILTRLRCFSQSNVQTLIQAMSDLAQRPVFQVSTVEHEVETIRRSVAKSLHKEVVLQADFIGYLHVLKDFFLLSRGEVFQTFIERTFEMMRWTPTTKSEDDVNHGVWRDVVRHFRPKEDKWSHDFDLQLPLQSFALTNFATTDNLLLFNVAKTSACLSIATNTHLHEVPSGSVWWQHAQQDGHSFVSEWTLQWKLADFSRASHRVALLLRNEGTLGPATLVNGSFELHDSQAVYLCIDLAIESLGDGMRVMAQVKPSSGEEKDLQTSPIVKLSMENIHAPELCVRIQYARQEASPLPTQVTYTKMIAVVVNDVLMMETPVDLPQLLNLHASMGAYWIGLGFSTFIQLKSWCLSKYPAQTYWQKGNCVHLKDCNSTVPPRDLWHALTLRCTVPWPLQLLVAPPLLRSYGHLFQFCFRLKRVAYALEVAWKRCTSRSYHTSGTRPAFAAGTLRSRMTFVVRTLEWYFQVGVIQCKFNKCVEQIRVAEDFDRAKRVHETFVASVVKSCYVHTKTITSALDELLNCCWQFAEAMMQDAPVSIERLALLDDEFARRFEFLYSVMQISEARDLLFLLDSNGFFAVERERRKLATTGADRTQ